MTVNHFPPGPFPARATTQTGRNDRVELERAPNPLASEGFYDLWPPRVILVPDHAEAVATGRERTVPASTALSRALSSASPGNQWRSG
jgi:hypothetical protein